MVTVVKTNPPSATIQDYEGDTCAQYITQYATQFGPTEDPTPRMYVRQVNDQGQPSGMLLDDRLYPWLRTRFDVYVRRDQVIVYVEGQQRVCANFASSALTMSDVALGFWNVLYHTSAEFTETRQNGATDRPATGQHHIMWNTPFANDLIWDNVGFQENMAAPSDFDPARCL